MPRNNTSICYALILLIVWLRAGPKEREDVKRIRELMAQTVADITHPTQHHIDTLQIKALGAEGLRLCPDWRSAGLTRLTLLASPAIWRNGQLIAAPLAGKPNGWQANLTTSFDRFASVYSRSSFFRH